MASIIDQMVRSDRETFESRRGGPIRVPGFDRPLIPTFERTREIDGNADIRAVIADLDLPGRWHGLAVTGLRRSFYEESDVAAFQVRFAEPPDRVRDTLVRQRLQPAAGGRGARARGGRPFDLYRHRADRRRGGADVRVGMTGTTAHRLRNIIGGSAGNLVEWYDWYVYSAFALYFAPVFFPEGDRTSQLLNAAAIFAVGFVMRPIGAWLMGIYADRKGRKAGLTLSVSLMCLGSLTDRGRCRPTPRSARWRRRSWSSRG